MKAKSILIVEDEVDLAGVVAFHLEKEGYVCKRCGDGESALTEISRQKPDLILLDRMLPRTSGDAVAARLKRDPQTAHIPILMMTAKADETDELVGFALGADDYIHKPFSMKVLSARISAILRRSEPQPDGADVLTGGPINLDRERFEVTADGNAVTLTATEFKILAALMAARGRVLSRDRLIDAVLGTGVAVTHRTIDVHVAAVRKKLGTAATWVQTVRGIGYAFRAPNEAESEG